VPALGKDEGGPLTNRSPRAVFLCYHSIAERGPEWLSLPPDLFERHLALLRRHGYVSGDTETLHRLAGGWRPPRPQVFITFDDGFADNHAVAAALLREYGFSASVFVLPPLLDDGAPLDWAQVEAQRLAHPDVMRSMTWSQVEELAAAGWTVGSHTLSHPSLPACDPQRCAEELLESRSAIRERLGRCDLLAYPFGAWSPAVARAAATAGYSAAFTAPGTGQWRADVLSIPRIAVDRRDSERRFAVKLSAAARTLLLSPLKKVVRASRSALAPHGR